MDHSNPYTPPKSRLSDTPSGLTGLTRTLLVCLVAMQLIVALFALPNGLQLVRHGDISPLAFLGAVLATGVLVLGGVVILIRRRASALLFSATAIGLLTAMQWHPPFILTGIAISFLEALVVLRADRLARKRVGST